MIPFRRSLAFRVFLTSFILLCLPLLVDSFVLLQRRFQESITTARKYIIEIPKLRELSFTELFPSKNPIAPLLNNALELEKKFPKKPDAELNKKLKDMAKQGNFVKILLMSITDNNEYKIIASSNEQEIGKDETKFIQSLGIDMRKEETSLLYVVGERKYYFMNVKYILSQEKTPIGLIVVYTDISERLNTLLLPDLSHYPVYFAVLSEDSIVFAATDLDILFQYFTELDEDERGRVIAISQEGLISTFLPIHPLPVSDAQDFPFFSFIWKNRERLAVITQIGDSPFYLLSYVSKVEAYASLFTNFAHIYSTYAVILLVGGGFAYLITRRLAEPLNTLSTVMKEIQKGNDSLRYRYDRFGFEINQVGDTFNEMLDSLIDKKKTAEEARVKSEIYQKELALGEQVQKALFLEKKIAPPGVEVATRYLPAKEVGGDFCDLLLLDDNTFVLMIADAAGKGVEACFYSLLVRGMLRIFSKELKDVAKVVKKTNDLFIQDVEKSGMFVTVLIAFYHPETRELTYCSAGHNPPILRKKNGETMTLNSHGTALGVPEQHEREADSVILQPGETVVFYTDGVTEAHNRENQLFTEQKLHEVIIASGNKHPEHLADEILQKVHLFENGAPQHDDITLIVMKVEDV